MIRGAHGVCRRCSAAMSCFMFDSSGRGGARAVRWWTLRCVSEAPNNTAIIQHAKKTWADRRPKRVWKSSAGYETTSKEAKVQKDKESVSSSQHLHVEQKIAQIVSGTSWPIVAAARRSVGTSRRLI